jgi:transposase-like protein
MTEEKTVPVEDIILDERLQARAEINHEAVTEYAEAYRTGAKLPALDVYRVSGKLYLVDGFHRIAAVRVTGQTFARIRVVGDGTIDDAVWHATAVNATHGLRRSNADKRRAVLLALRSGIGAEQSSAIIAEHVGVSRNLVAEIRREVEDVSSDDTSTRTDRLGRQQPARKPRRDVAKSDTSPVSAVETRIEYDEDAPQDIEPLPFEPEYREPSAKPLPVHGRALVSGADEIRTARLRAMKHATEEASHAWQRAERLLKDAESALRLAEPVTCPHCIGLGCVRCEERGWRPRSEVGR